MTRPITFLSDYRWTDEFAGVCRTVIARIAPEARVIDLAHGIPGYDVRHGAAMLARALPYAPSDRQAQYADSAVRNGDSESARSGSAGAGVNA